MSNFFWDVPNGEIDRVGGFVVLFSKRVSWVLSVEITSGMMVVPGWSFTSSTWGLVVGMVNVLRWSRNLPVSPTTTFQCGYQNRSEQSDLHPYSVVLVRTS